MVWVIVIVLVIAAFVFIRSKKTQTPPEDIDRHPDDHTDAHTEAPPSTWLPTPPGRSPIVTQPRARPSTHTHAQTTPRRDSLPFAAPGQKGDLFTYGGPRSRSSRHNHEGVYAVMDVETTGLSPRTGDRVIEIAVARVDANGRIEGEFATLINPQGRDTGPVFIHGITNEAVRNAPTFAEVAPQLLSWLDGTVVVAHNAPFEERFLAAEFARAGHRSLRMPALCTLWLGRQTFQTPNHKLGTLARHAGVPLVDKHAALGDVRAVAGLLPQMLQRYGQPVHYGCPPYANVTDSITGPSLRLVTRAVELRKGTDGWMHSLMARLPMSANEADDAATEAYLDALNEVLADGKIIGEEAKYLADLAGRAGMGGAQVETLNHRFLESMRQAALADEVLTAAEFKQLATAAKALGVPRYFDDLAPTGTLTATATAASDPVNEQVRQFRLERVRQGMDAGWTNAQLATDLGVSSGTVERLKRDVRGEPSDFNNQQRAARLERAQAALRLQESGLSRAAIAQKLEMSVESVKALLRDAKFYADPTTDPARLQLANAAHAARTEGRTRDQFGSTEGLTSGKLSEAWRDAAVLCAT